VEKPPISNTDFFFGIERKGPSLSGSFISQNFRDAENCFDIEPYHVTLIKEAGPRPTIQQFQCIISGYFGPLGSHKCESLTFFGNRKSFISILNKFRGHIKGAQKRRRPAQMAPESWAVSNASALSDFN